jgi:glycosyltransferase involved in cell wall biosynthesis
MRTLVAQRYSAFLPIYDGYADAVCRADAARYLILHALGGLYVDLDMQCLRPVDALIEGKELAIAVEPTAHLDAWKVRTRGLDKIVCPSFIAGASAHPFFEDVIRLLRDTHRLADVLDRTGPFMLTRACHEYAGGVPVTLLPADTVYPLSNQDCWSGKAFDIEFFERATRTAYAVHYWEGSWFRPPTNELPAMPTKFDVVVAGAKERRSSVSGSELVSCVMVTRDRYPFAQLAIEAFRRQTYPNRELVVLQDGADTRLLEEIEAARDPMIRAVRMPTDGLSLGELRNRVIAAARGPFVCQWDDDDLYDPARIATQLAALKAVEGDACFLGRWLMWMPLSRRLGATLPHLWEGSMLARKSALPPYASLTHAEDSTVTYQLQQRSRIALVNMPRLYLYAIHGRNAWAADHFETQWRRCASRYTGDRYDAVLAELGRRLPIAEYEGLLARGREKEAAAAEAPPSRSSGSSRSGEGDGCRQDGFNVFAHLASPTGIGVAGRSTLAALGAARIRHSVIDLDRIGVHPAGTAAAGQPDETAYRINVFQTTLDRLTRLADGTFRSAFMAGRYNIAYVPWESANTFPPSWREAFRHFDEIWVPSRFVAACLRPITALPIYEIPHVLPRRPVVLARSDLRFPKGRFVFLFIFDGLSGFNRKNPLATIEAFKRAFAGADEGVALIIKARTLSEPDRAKLNAAAAGSPISIFVEDVNAATLSSILAHADAFVSLHRAEGFGLAIAEAMQLKRPVIATAYSGNLDFMTPENSYLVPCRVVRQETLDPGYPAGTEWAEPDLDAAAEMMRAVVADPATARERGERAAADIAARFSPLVVAERIEKRLAEIVEGGRLERHRAPMHFVAAAHAGSPPNVLVLTPVKNARSFLPRYFELLERLDYDRKRLSLGLLEGDSDDGTYDALVCRLPDLRSRYRSVTLAKHDFRHRLDGPRWQREAQKARRAVLARARNRLLADALGDEDWVLWLDVDLIDYPPTLIGDLLAAGKEIVVPHCVLPGGATFDLNSFRFAPDRGPVEDPACLVDGIYQPPRGRGRRYIDELPRADDNGPVSIDAVGGTALLIRADLHREGLIFPPYSHRGYIETEGLAMMARDMGCQCWALPGLRVVHAAA